MGRCASHLRRLSGAALPLLLGTLLGCAGLRSQLVDPLAAAPELAQQAHDALAAAPLPSERQAQLAIEAQGQVFIAVGYFGVDLPDAFTAELTAPFGVTLLEVHRDGEDAQVVSAAKELQQGLTLGQFPRLLALWLLGDCSGGEVWQGANGLVVDCPANGPDAGLTWRIWIDPDTGLRTRGELLRGKRRLADFVCDADGRCVLQDPVHGYALRVVPAR